MIQEKWIPYDPARHFGHIKIEETGEEYQRRIQREMETAEKMREKRKRRKGGAA